MFPLIWEFGKTFQELRFFFLKIKIRKKIYIYRKIWLILYWGVYQKRSPCNWEPQQRTQTISNIKGETPTQVLSFFSLYAPHSLMSTNPPKTQFDLREKETRCIAGKRKTKKTMGGADLHFSITSPLPIFISTNLPPRLLLHLHCRFSPLLPCLHVIFSPFLFSSSLTHCILSLPSFAWFYLFPYLPTSFLFAEAYIQSN